MAGGFCLLPSEVDKFRSKLVDGTINPEKLSKMTSEERHAFLKDIVGEGNAKGVNSLFESKLLLKNQQKGMITWAKKVTGVSPEARRDMLSRIARLDSVLSPSDEKAFLHDLAETKLGVAVTPSEAKTIAGMSKKIEDSLAKVDRTSKDGSASRLAYGHAAMDLESYMLDLKSHANRTKPLDFVKHPVKTAGMAAGQFKAINASMDDSALGNQGWKVLMSHPVVWGKNATKSFSDLVKTFGKGGKQKVEMAIRAEIMSRENSLNGFYRKIKLDVGTIEEPFPTTLPEKIPVLGRAYKASENAFAGFNWRNRADLADLYKKVAEHNGVNLKDPAELKSFGKFVNSLGSRGDLGRFEGAAKNVNALFFSPRNLKANFDVLTAHSFQKGVSPFVRKQAALNLVKIVLGTATVLGIAEALRPGSVEWNPRSADFGKIKIGDTRFNVTGGMGSIVTLASRVLPDPKDLATGKGVNFYSKSSTTGQTNKLNSGKFGSQTAMDVLDQFIQGKLSPTAGTVRDFWKGQDMQGNKTSIGTEARNLVTPLSVQNYHELVSDPNSANTLAAMIADGLGIATNTYGIRAKDWSSSTSKEITQFKGRVSPQDFKTANQQYNQKVKAFETKALQDPRYQKMPQSQQQAVLTAAENKIRTQVFKDHGFQYKENKTNAKQNTDFIKQFLRAPASKSAPSAQLASRPITAPDPSLKPSSVDPSGLQKYQSGSGRDKRTWFEDPSGTKYIQQNGKLFQVKTRGVPLLKTQPRSKTPTVEVA